MRKKRILILAALVVVGAGLAFYCSRPKEPCYQGRNLTSWLSEIEKVGVTAESGTALNAIGTNAIPYLLKLLQTKRSHLKDSIDLLLMRQSITRFRFDSSYHERERAVSGFMALGTNGRPAIPLILTLTASTNEQVRIAAFKCLFFTEPEKTTFLKMATRALTDSNHVVRVTGATFLDLHYPEEAEKSGVYKMFPSIKSTPRTP